MNKIITLLALCFTLLGVQNLYAQDPPSFIITPSNLTPVAGDQITVDVIADQNFANVVGLQFGLNYNGAALEYISHTTPSVTFYSVNKRPNKSELVNIYIDIFGTSPINVNQGDIIYTITFDVLSDIGNTIDIICGEGEVTCEYTVDDGSGSVKLNGMEVSQPGDINGGGASENLGPIEVMASSPNGPTGSNVCVEIAVANFINIVGTQYSMHYDSTVLSYTGIVQDVDSNNGDCLPSDTENPLCLGDGNINLVEPGTLTFTWSDFIAASSQTLEDGTVIMDICFDVIGAGGTTSSFTFDGDPTIIQVTKAGEGNENFGLVPTSGTITVTGTGGPLDVVSYSIGSIGGDNGTNVCVPVVVNDGFDDILGFGWSVNYDASILDYTGMINVDSQISTLFDNEPTPGNLSFLWSAPFAANSEVSIADGSTLYEMCFDVIGNSGQSSDITFGDSPNPVETVKIDGPDPGVERDLTSVMTTNGEISVTNSDGFNLLFCEAEACPSDQVCLPLLATGAVNLAGLSFTVEYDIDVLEFSNIQGHNPATTVANENASNSGFINVLYIDINGGVLNLENCETFAEFCFDVIGSQGTASEINITGSTTAINAAVIAADGSTQEIPFGRSDGLIDINCAGTAGAPIIECECGVTTPELAIDEAASEVNDITCNGDNDGSINVSVSGGATPLTYSWSNSVDTKDISDLGPGTYTLTITDASSATASATFTIAEPQILQPSTTANNTSTGTANDGSITLNVQGGTPAYQYLWTNGETTANVQDLAPGSYTVTITDDNGCTVATSRQIGTNLSIGGGTSISNVACFGENTGAVDLAIEGGIAPYVFSWNNSVNQEDLNGLAAGTYCVTVTDTNGESINDCFEVTGPMATLDIITVSQTNQSLPGANDGGLDINIAGGESPYTYLWNGPGISNIDSQDLSGLTEGTYTVQVTDNRGCVRSRTFFLETTGEALSINSGASQVVGVQCFGDDNGSINPSITGGTTPYSYAWSGPDNYFANTDNISGLAGGSYQLTVTDAAGETAESVVFLINEPAAPLGVSVNINPESTPGANDGGINLTVSGGTPNYSYNWNNANPNGADNFALASGTYTVTITDAQGCTLFESIDVPFDADPLVIDANASTVNSVRCFGDSNGSISAEANGGFPPYTYAWSPGGQNTKDISGLAAGSYTLTLTDQNGGSAIQTFIVMSPTQIDIAATSVQESANGNDGSISINVTGGTPGYTYSWSGPDNYSSTQEDITNLGEGLYTITVIDANGCSEQRDIALGAILNIENKFETDVDCFGECTGEIDIVIVGGQPPYLYAWSGPDNFTATTQDLSGLCAGTYTATVTDAFGQEVFSTCRVDEPLLPLSIGANPTIIDEVVPNNGSINITVSGGTAPYTYVWNQGSTSEDLVNIPAGSYGVTITDANGCIIISPEYTVERIPLEINVENLEINSPTCSGDCNGSVIVSVVGGDAPYIFSWSDGVSQTLATSNPTYTRNMMCAGQYTLTITDANGQEEPISIELIDAGEIVLTEQRHQNSVVTTEQLLQVFQVVFLHIHITGLQLDYLVHRIRQIYLLVFI